MEQTCSCCVPKSTNMHSEYVMLIAFPLQQWLHERALNVMLCIHFLSCSVLNVAPYKVKIMLSRIIAAARWSKGHRRHRRVCITDLLTYLLFKRSIFTVIPKTKSHKVKYTSLYRGADKSLARPGRKHANISVLECAEFPSAPCLAGKKNLMTARVSMLLKSCAPLTCFRTCFLSGRANDLLLPRQNDFVQSLDASSPLCSVIQ